MAEREALAPGLEREDTPCAEAAKRALDQLKRLTGRHC